MAKLEKWFLEVEDNKIQKQRRVSIKKLHVPHRISKKFNF